MAGIEKVTIIQQKRNAHRYTHVMKEEQQYNKTVPGIQKRRKKGKLLHRDESKHRIKDDEHAMVRKQNES